jgi:SSS family solute:Na+ symporter
LLRVADYVLIILYLVVLLSLGVYRRLKKDSSPSELIVGGRVLTLPAFVASLVSTWYGGILGVGEYSFRYGISNWIVFGLPYYVAAFLFALFLAKKARESEALTIPDRLARAYDNRTAVAGSVIIYLMTVPAAYVLMLGVLCQHLFGWPFWTGAVLGTLFSVGYVYLGGFQSVVRTDLFQFALMFLGFVVLLVVLVSEYGGPAYLRANLPETHLTWHGGRTTWYIATWYFIALATLIEPAFYQRCYAARTAATARAGIFVSIACWALFDFLTTTCGLYARAILPHLSDPVSSYPALALEVLPVGLMGLFALAMLSTAMSTVDSYSFLAASTFGNDIVQRLFGIDHRKVTMWTRWGLVLSALLAVVLAIYFRSVVEIWYVFGSVGTPALLVPVFSAFVGRRRLPSRYAFCSIVVSGAVSLAWYVLQQAVPGEGWWHQVPPIFPGLFCSVAAFALFSRKLPEGLRQQ